MTALHYIGFDVHKKTISYCVKTAAGEIVEEGVVAWSYLGEGIKWNHGVSFLSLIGAVSFAFWGKL